MYRIMMLIGIGGGVGSICRFLMQQVISKNTDLKFPLGTFIVNSIGCLLIGLFYGYFERSNFTNQEWRIFLTTGFCGGFTTFSAFSYENLQLLKQEDFMNFFLYTIGSIVIGILFVLAGIFISKYKF